MLLFGVVSGRGALSFSLKKSLARTRCPFVLPKRKCQEATTGNGGRSNGGGDGDGGSGSTEVSICSLGLVICVLDITARDLRCVPAISRTRARVSSPARLGSARRPLVSPSRVLSLPLSLRIRTKSFALRTLPAHPGSEGEAMPRGAERDSRGNRHGEGSSRSRRDLFSREREEQRTHEYRPIDKSRKDDGPRDRGTVREVRPCVR